MENVICSECKVNNTGKFAWIYTKGCISCEETIKFKLLHQGEPVEFNHCIKCLDILSRLPYVANLKLCNKCFVDNRITFAKEEKDNCTKDKCKNCDSTCDSDAAYLNGFVHLARSGLCFCCFVKKNSFTKEKPKYPRKWESIPNEISIRKDRFSGQKKLSSTNIFRLQVFGGWLIGGINIMETESDCHGSTYSYAQQDSLCFIPDPNHEWELEDERV